MAEHTIKKDNNYIPILTGLNYGEWNICMTIHLQCKELLDVCEKPLGNDASIPMTNKWNEINSTYNGTLHKYINNCRLVMLQLETVNITVPPELPAFTLLGKLLKDPKLQHFIEVLTLNENLVENPDLILSKLEEFYNNSFSHQPPQEASPSAFVSESSGP
ncbi:hypothetical protein O181_005783 [Austropuccinia psidii MF-1]|uniref:DUF4219 domain-containing protein n=1 Tax=Austropuccinia psidii MF-1 TaxID=1389203 RepID=A0A9Q3BIX3_9BASI|nr:hypothetical protein [Austropuccinia psidii MF-1]